ncbi:MAG: LuxR C-terminal-related transcriptional regulator [Paracoccaceae bacterium]
MKTISVGFVDDHPILLSGLAALFSAHPEFLVVGVGHSARDAMDIVLQHRPDVLIVDLNMPGKVLEMIAEITVGRFGTKVLTFTAATGIDDAISALEAGAGGYVLKGSTGDELMEAVRTVHAGDTYITASYAAKVVAGLRTASLRKSAIEAMRLSMREEQVLRLLLRGSTNREIASTLEIGEKTVKHYMTILMQKLNVRNRVEVVLAAQQLEIGKGPQGLARMM